MKIVIENLYGLICIPFVMLFLWWSIKKQQGTKLSRGIITSRIVICTLIIGALCGVSCKLVGKNAATVFLLDVSDSMRDFREEGITFVHEALQDMPRHHKAGVIVFGGDSQVDKFMDESKLYGKISGTPISTSTNIEQALQQAVAYFPEEASKEIILLSDGQENEGDMLKAVELIQGAEIDFKAYKIGHEKQSELYIDEMTVPEKIYKNEKFSVVTKIVSNIKTKAKLTLFEGNEKKSEQEVELEVGENTFVFQDVQSSGGFKSYRTMITAKEDHEIGNNEYTSYTTVEDTPQVLVIEGNEGDGLGIEVVLKEMGGSYKVTSPQYAPGSLQKMMAYKAIVLSNVFADELAQGFLEHIESYVKSYGGGLIVTGGEDAYALGGYQNTVLEDILPVDMHKKGQMAMPSTSLCLVIDHSGSMSEGMGAMNKLGLSLQAAVNVVDYLEEKDEISVISFDDSYAEVVKRQLVTNKDEIKSLIGGIQQGGGTSIYPALQAAYKTQFESKADIKHIILLTDGQDGMGLSQYGELVQNINENKITLSTVAVGQGANNHLLTQLADEGGGRNYIADQTTNLPHIFAKEFFLSSGEYLVNETFTPEVTSNHEVLQGIIEEGGFLLNGYIGTSMKPLATQVLASHQGEPILGLWQYGLGKTVAWTSDVNGGWSGPLFEGSKGVQLFKNILSWSMTTYEGKGKVSVSQEGAGAKVVFTTNDIKAGKKVTTRYQDAAGKEQQVELTEVSPGTYESYIPLEANGFYAFNVTEDAGGQNPASYITAFAKQYSKEYKFADEENKLMQLVEAVGGKLITLPSEVFKVENKKSYKTIELTNIFLLLAFILFMLDIIVRRFKLSIASIGTMIGYVNEKQRQKTKISMGSEASYETGTYRASKRKAKGNKVEDNKVEDNKVKDNRVKDNKVEDHKVKAHKMTSKQTHDKAVKSKESKMASGLDTMALLKSKRDRETER